MAASYGNGTLRVEIRGISPLIMHSRERGLDTFDPLAIEEAEINRRKGGNRTASDVARSREIGCHRSLWLDDDGKIAIPTGAFRACLENAARKLKQGGDVREGLLVIKSEFKYDRETLGSTPDEVARNKTAQFTVPVMVQKQAVQRTRARFTEWGAVFTLDTDPELVDLAKLERWVDIGGRRIGLGDWRPGKSGGEYGRFELVSLTELDSS